MTATALHPEPSFEEAAGIQQFWEQNYKRMLKEYPEQYVAARFVHGRPAEVVAANPDLAMLTYELRDKGIDVRTDVAIQFISAGSASLLL